MHSHVHIYTTCNIASSHLLSLADFGLSKPVIHDIVGDTDTRCFPGSPLYKCPEMLAR